MPSSKTVPLKQRTQFTFVIAGLGFTHTESAGQPYHGGAIGT